MPTRPTPVRFDDGLKLAVDAVQAELPAEASAEGVFLRDVSGRLAYFAGQPLDEQTRVPLERRLRESLGAYAREDRVVAGSDEFGATAILKDPTARRVQVGNYCVRLIDRRLVGLDWERPPAPIADTPPRFVFASLKGGVGRSTALAVVAAELASRGRRVLAIDLDLEAPGLGAMLLNEETRPEFGVIDALVEGGISGLDDALLVDSIGPSALAGGDGRIDVMPAFGRRSMRYPAAVLSKLARAYIEVIGPNGEVFTILDQIRHLVSKVTQMTRYDAVLVDARAGLHETSAASILGLGAEVFLFGQDEPQTFEGYRVLFAHLARFLIPEGPVPEWLIRISIVHAKAPAADLASRQAYAERWESLLGEVGFKGRGIEFPRETYSVGGEISSLVWDDEVSDAVVLPEDEWLRPPLVIVDDKRFARFDPHNRRDQFSSHVYRESFGELLDAVEEAITVSQTAKREDDG